MNERETNELSALAEEVFLEAVEQKDRASRAALIDSACAGNAPLRELVLAMLSDFRKATQFFDDTAQHFSLPDGLMPGEELEAGTTIGPYRIVGLIAEGGSSKVYEAEQSAPVSRRVALKVLKAGMDTAAVIARFEAERQTLAILEHPNISKVLDAGATDKGRPFFVMELVHGKRITDYCEENHLPVGERLRLFCQICSALQHAHNKGIIHRDIKPSNILVSTVDGIAIPKLIDFGIAKATDPRSGEAVTQQGQPIGTPAYMSPEQIGGWNRDVDTRSDIYSLGVVLYELLAGQPPFDNDELLDAGFEKMRHRIQNEVPLRPSLLKPEDRGARELDWIVMKAIEKDREKRYSTAHAFAADIESFMRGDPVQAHPPSRLYRLKKLLLRNRLAAASIAVAALALFTGFSVSTLLYLRAHAAEQEQTSLREAAEERAHMTKAAILIMEDRLEEADAEVTAMGGLFTQPSVEATNVFRTLAIWNANNGNWKTSADRWLAMARVCHFDTYDMTDKATRDLLPIAPTLVMINDFERYGQFREFLIDKLGNTTYPFAAEHVLKLCLIVPAPHTLLARLQHVAQVAEQSMPEGEQTPPAEWMEAWRCVALALWNYRNERFEKAVSWSNRSLLRHDWEEVRRTQTLLIRAMALKKLGRIDEAVTDLEIARSSVNQHIQQPIDQMKDGHFHDWLNASILLGEAERAVLEAR
jgi:hypothetical protein